MTLSCAKNFHFLPISLLVQIFDFMPKSCQELCDRRVVSHEFADAIDNYVYPETWGRIMSLKQFKNALKRYGYGQRVIYKMFRDKTMKYVFTEICPITKCVISYKFDINETLFFATMYGNLSIVEILLQIGANPNYTKKCICYPDGFVSACSETKEKTPFTDDDLVDVITIIHDCNVQVHDCFKANKKEKQNGEYEYMSQQIHDISVLMVAAYSNKHQCVHHLIVAGASIDMITYDGYTALNIAAEYRSHDVVIELLRAGANYEIRTNCGMNILLYAAKFKWVDVVKYILTKNTNVDVNITDNNDVSLLMKIISCHGYNIFDLGDDDIDEIYAPIVNKIIELIHLVAKYNLNINYQNKDGKTALMYEYWCRVQGKRNIMMIVETLLFYGANPNIVDGEGRHVLNMAICHPEIVKILLAKNTNPNIDDGYVLLHAINERYYTSASYLLDAGVITEYDDNRGQTPLTSACGDTCMNIDIIRKLLQKGANVNHKISNGKTALMFAAERGSPDIFRLLIEYNANYNDVDNVNYNALGYACVFGKTEIVKILLGLNINLEAGGGNKKTPLMIAAERGHFDIVKELVNARTTIVGKAVQYDSAIYVAEKNKHFEIAKFLRGQ